MATPNKSFKEKCGAYNAGASLISSLLPEWVGPSSAQVGASRAQVGGPKPGPCGWAQAGPKWVTQAGPKWVGPSRAQVGGPKLGPSQNFGTQKIQKIKILKIKIRSAQNVDKVWISRKKCSWPHLGPSGPIFCVGRNTPKNVIFFLPIVLGGPMGGKVDSKQQILRISCTLLAGS